MCNGVKEGSPKESKSEDYIVMCGVLFRSEGSEGVLEFFIGYMAICIITIASVHADKPSLHPRYHANFTEASNFLSPQVPKLPHIFSLADILLITAHRALTAMVVHQRSQRSQLVILRSLVRILSRNLRFHMLAGFLKF